MASKRINELKVVKQKSKNLFEHFKCKYEDLRDSEFRNRELYLREYFWRKTASERSHAILYAWKYRNTFPEKSDMHICLWRNNRYAIVHCMDRLVWMFCYLCHWSRTFRNSGFVIFLFNFWIFSGLSIIFQ